MKTSTLCPETETKMFCCNIFYKTRAILIKFDLYLIFFFTFRINHFPPHLDNVLLLLTVKYSQLEQTVSLLHLRIL